MKRNDAIMENYLSVYGSDPLSTLVEAYEKELKVHNKPGDERTRAYRLSAAVRTFRAARFLKFFVENIDAELLSNPVFVKDLASELFGFRVSVLLSSKIFGIDANYDGTRSYSSSQMRELTDLHRARANDLAASVEADANDLRIKYKPNFQAGRLLHKSRGSVSGKVTKLRVPSDIASEVLAYADFLIQRKEV